MILGSAGMLGHMVYNYLKSLDKYKMVDASYPQKLHEDSKLIDVTNKTELEEFIIAENPDVVVNCIGILIKSSQNDPSNAIYLNSYLPHQLTRILRKTGGRLIHISTDCVFSGKKGCYDENDFRDADDTYGRSKALGEVINNIDVTLRTSIIGPELKVNGEGLFHWFMYQTGVVNGFTKTFWGGVTTLQLAKSIDLTIDKKFAGLMHISNGERISKFDLLKIIKSIWSIKNIDINPIDGKPADKSLKSSLQFDFKVPLYEIMLNELFDWMTAHKQIYKDNYSERL